MVYSVILWINNIIEVRYVTDCVKASAAGMGFGIGYYLDRRYIGQEEKSKIPEKILKLAAGLIGVILIKIMPDLTIENLFTEAAAYVLIPIWVLAIYPWLFQKIKTTIKK